MNWLVTALLSFVGAAVGSWAMVRYARTVAYDKVAGEMFARRRLDLVETLAGLLNDAADVFDTAEGAESLRPDVRDSGKLLTDLGNALPLARLYFGSDFHQTFDDIRFSLYHVHFPETNYSKPAREPDFSRAWELLEEAAHGKRPRTRSTQPVPPK